jgi:hypothetical protein
LGYLSFEIVATDSLPADMPWEALGSVILLFITACAKNIAHASASATDATTGGIRVVIAGSGMPPAYVRKITKRPDSCNIYFSFRGIRSAWLGWVSVGWEWE